MLIIVFLRVVPILVEMPRHAVSSRLMHVISCVLLWCHRCALDGSSNASPQARVEHVLTVPLCPTPSAGPLNFAALRSTVARRAQQWGMT